MMIKVRGMEHVGMHARDTVQLSQWYRDVLGAQVISQSDDEHPIVFLTFGEASLLEIIPAPADRQNVQEQDVGAQNDEVHLCFSVENMDDSINKLAEAGIRLEKPVFRAYEGSSVAFFRDKEGNLLQLVERVPGSAVHATVFQR